MQALAAWLGREESVIAWRFKRDRLISFDGQDILSGQNIWAP